MANHNQKLVLECSIINLTPTALVLENAGRSKNKQNQPGVAPGGQEVKVIGELAASTFPAEDSKAHARWIDQETLLNYSHRAHYFGGNGENGSSGPGQECFTDIVDHYYHLPANEVVLGSLNGYFNLVEPNLEHIKSLLGFWRKSQAVQHAHTVDLPELPPNYQFGVDPKVYYVVTCNVAILAYLEDYPGLDYLLVPALPSEQPDGGIAYRALVSMQQVREALAAEAQEQEESERRESEQENAPKQD